MPESLATLRWIHGAPDCAASTDPVFQVHRFDQNTFILRQSKCVNFEGPFLYLLFGSEKALLVDSGAKPPAGQTLPIVETIDSIVKQWLDERHRQSIELVVAHSHGHGDHVFGDSLFAARPHTTVVGRGAAEVAAFFGLAQWPEGQATYDLGHRALTILPLPGHEPAHIAIYDPDTHIILTGDTLYPGMLTVADWPAYRRSAARLAEFAKGRPIAYVLGAHVEMKKTPREMYPLPCTFQPEEHALPLAARHIQELHEACEAIGEQARRDVHDEFIIQPRSHG